MKTTSDQLDVTFYQRVAILLTLCALSGCDAFLVSICEFEGKATCTADLSNLGMEPKPMDGGQIPDIVERKFVDFDSKPINNAYKFNGISQKKLLITKNNPFDWETWKYDLKKPDKLQSADTIGLPGNPRGFDFFNDEIHAAGGKFYYLQYGVNNQLFEIVGSGLNQITIAKLISHLQSRVFAHPVFDALVVATDPMVPPNYDAFISLRGEKRSLNLGPSTNFVIGDLDSNDMAVNGDEIIAFQGDAPSAVIHWDSKQNLVRDDHLLTSLQMAVRRTGVGNSPIDAAFIANLNGDDFPDFIYARNGKIYVTSYIGIGNEIGSRFKNWTKAIAMVPTGTIKSLVAVELTGDMFPELVVETDTAVHFYVNTP